LVGKRAAMMSGGTAIVVAMVVMMLVMCGIFAGAAGWFTSRNKKPR